MITGGAGFVGRAVVAAFREAGVEVVAVDREPLPDDVEGVRAVHGDLQDPGVWERALTGAPTGIVHLAADTSVLRSVEDPGGTYRNNVELTHTMLEAARRHGLSRVVLASTNAVVGDVGTDTIRETSPLRPLTPYGSTKAACEMLLSGHTGAYGLSGCALRFTNIYGPGMDAKDSFVPRLMRVARDGGTAQVFGDGRQRRDLVYVEDVARAVLAAWSGDTSGPVIVGSGTSTSVLDLIDAARAATGRPIPVEHVAAKPGEMPAVVVDVTRARTELSWSATTGLDDGLAVVWKDFLGARSIDAPARSAS